MQANRVSPRHISFICIALCIVFAGGYILRQNYLLDQAYKKAAPYDYIPAGEIEAILETTPSLPLDSTAALPYQQQTRTLVVLWQEIRSAAGLPPIDTIILSFTREDEVALWYRASRQEQKRLNGELPRLLSNNYHPVSETSGPTTVRHYALQNGTFLHTLSAPGTIAFSFGTDLFNEALQTVDVLALREQFTHALHSLAPQASARLLQQVNDFGYRSSGRWRGANIYPRTTAPRDTAASSPDLPPETKSVPPPTKGNGTAG